MASEAPKTATPAAPGKPAAVPPPVHSAGAPHSAVTPKPAATSRIPATPHPAATPRAAATPHPATTYHPAAQTATPHAGATLRPSAPTAAAPTVTPHPATIPTASAKASRAATPATIPTAPTAAAKAAAATNFDLPAAVYSPQLLESVIYDLQYYLDWIRQNQIRKQVGAKPKDEPNHSDETVLVIEAWLAGKPATINSIEALLEHLKNLKLPEVHIMLAALPNRSQRIALVEWFRNNTSKQLLLSFVADRNLGGGLVVRTPNRVFDFTWKQELIASRDKLAGILKSV